jgi:hypothetical protein
MVCDGVLCAGASGGVCCGVLVVELWATAGKLIVSAIDKNPAAR